MKTSSYPAQYTGEHLNYIAFPLGGLGAGMYCLQGNGMPGSFSLRGKPDIYNEPVVFAAVTAEGVFRVLEGPVPCHKVMTESDRAQAGNGLYGKNYGLPRFRSAAFTARFPFAEVKLSDGGVPLEASLTGWSPFTPPEPDDSSLPFAALEYTFRNNTDRPVGAVFYFAAMNFMKQDAAAEVRRSPQGGFALSQPGTPAHPEWEGEFTAWLHGEDARVNTALFRGGWFDTLSMLANDIQAGVSEDRAYADGSTDSPGACLSLPITLAPGEVRTVKVCTAWYVPVSTERTGAELDCGCDCDCTDVAKAGHRPWYTSKFGSAGQVAAYIQKHYDRLRADSEAFAVAFAAQDLPHEVLEAVSANLSILKSPTILRQSDGRLWAWEGCCNDSGCCAGSCTHVWNYAQALCHLFPSLERSLRQTEFTEAQSVGGHQNFRASLPIRPSAHDDRAASDGQLGGLMKLYREYTISGDLSLLRRYYSRAKASLDYCINTWDPGRIGALVEPHHNTYDIEFWGADGMCTSFYLGGLCALVRMGELLGQDVDAYRTLYQRGRAFMESELWNGEYFIQKTQWEGLREKLPLPGEAKINDTISDDAAALMRAEGPKYQYGTGCLSDGVLGAWLAKLCGLGDILDPEKVRGHLLAVYRHNRREDLTEHCNPQRPGYALGDEGGLLLCTWPNGGRPKLPFVYSDEVWTGIEYQVASHLMLMGEAGKGLDLVRLCRARYDGAKRNPFDEYECGHWYARALASYALLEGWTGTRYDASAGLLTVRGGAAFTALLCTESGYGLVRFNGQAVALDVVRGEIPVKEIIIL